MSQPSRQSKRTNQPAPPKRRPTKRNRSDASPSSNKKMIDKSASPSTALADSMLSISLSSDVPRQPVIPENETSNHALPPPPQSAAAPIVINLDEDGDNDLLDDAGDEKERVPPQSQPFGNLMAVPPKPPRTSTQSIFLVNNPGMGKSGIVNKGFLPPRGPGPQQTGIILVVPEPPYWQDMSQAPLVGLPAMPGSPCAQIHYANRSGTVLARAWSYKEGGSNSFDLGCLQRLRKYSDPNAHDLHPSFYSLAPHNTLVVQSMARDGPHITPLSSRTKHWDASASAAVSEFKKVFYAMTGAKANYLVAGSVNVEFETGTKKKKMNESGTLFNFNYEAFTTTDLMIVLDSDLIARFLVVIAPPGANADERVKVPALSGSVIHVRAFGKSQVTILTLPMESEGQTVTKGAAIVFCTRKQQVPIGSRMDENSCWET